MDTKLIIVSNRLPFKIIKKGNRLEIQKSSGGLVSAIESSINKNDNVLWIGAANFSEEIWEDYKKTNRHENFPIVPIFLDKVLERNFYDGFSNSVIWPLFHYFPSFANYKISYYSAYKAVNEIFYTTISSIVHQNDVIWIHDYHLMVLPGLIKQTFPHNPTGFFLHIPFPSYEILKLIPQDWRSSILTSLLQADVIGFHTKEYVSHFKRCLSFFLGIEMNNQTASYLKNTVLIKHYPISIDFNKFHSAYDLPEVAKVRNQIREKYRSMKLIFSVDRLDYTKGVINRLQAFEEVLRENPQLRRAVSFIINVVPSRDRHEKYAEKRKAIEESVGHINGLYGSVHWQPIIYQYSHLAFSQLMAFYTACDVALVTPLRDGMNLVAKEFVASRKDKAGALILGEYTGSAEELPQAILVNPNDILLMKDAMITALNLSKEQQEQTINKMQETIRNNDITKWTRDFLYDLKHSSQNKKTLHVRIMSFDERMELFEKFKNAKNRLILLDYDGTLVNYCDDPANARPDQRTKDLLTELSGNERNKVILVSGRTMDSLDDFFPETPLEIVAEHGCFYKAAPGDRWEKPEIMTQGWKPGAREIFEKYVQLVPGSFIEEKQHALTWHYRRSSFNEEETIIAICRELTIHNATGEFDVLCGNKVIEARNAYFNKGKFVLEYLQRSEFDFVIAIGDDTTDEDMFAVLTRENQFTIRVGLDPTCAMYNLIGVSNVLSFLEQLTSFKTIPGSAPVSKEGA